MTERASLFRKVPMYSMGCTFPGLAYEGSVGQQLDWASAPLNLSVRAWMRRFVMVTAISRHVTRSCTAMTPRRERR